MLHQIIVLLFLAILCWNNKIRKGTWFTMSSFVFLLYFFSIVASLFYVPIFHLQNILYKDEYISSAIVFCVSLCIWFYPFIKFNENAKKEIVLPNERILNIFAICLIVLSLLSIVYFIPICIRVFSTANLADARASATNDGNQFLQVGLLNTISSVSASFYAIAIFMGYIFLCQQRQRMAYLLFFSSISYVLNVFAYAGRDGALFWVLTMLCFAWFFRDYMNIEQKRIIKKLFLLGTLLVAPLFIMITLDRFEEQSLFASIIDYYGQPYCNFCLFMELDLPISHGSAFPLFREILGLPYIEPEGWESTYTASWVFGTFLKSLFSNFGVGGTMLIAIFCALFVTLALHPKRESIYFNELFILTMYFQVVFQGVFYFRQYHRGGNLYLILSVLFYFAFKRLSEKSDNKLVKL